jgi:RNA polymerase sigma factor (sigma-70 family)
MTIFVENAALLALFRDGDRDALATVYWRYVDKVERLLRAGCVATPRSPVAGVGGSPADLEDLMQEVFERAFAPAARAAYDGSRPYAPYLFAIARNVLADWWRRQGREIPTDWPFFEATLVGTASDQPYADAATVAIVERFLHGLPADLRAVHEKRFVTGLSQREAAAALGIGRQVLRTLEARLTEMLRATLQSEGPLRPAVAAMGSGARERTT